MPKLENSEKRIVYIFTSFPKLSERFLQRELEGLDNNTDLRVEIHAFLGRGCSSFKSFPIIRFTYVDWFRIPHRLLREIIQNPAACFKMLSLSFRSRPKSLINVLEHSLGITYAILRAAEFRKNPPLNIHAVWATGPASAAFFLHLMNGTRFSMGSHAYDLFRNGGDMMLLEKSRATNFIHTSTCLARDEMIKRGINSKKIHLIRRSAPTLVEPKRDNHFSEDRPIRILSVGRLIEKKGYPELLKILRYFNSIDIRYSAVIIGDGPLRGTLEQYLTDSGLKKNVTLLGGMPNEEVENFMRESADLFFFTGKETASGDRDGLPNVIIESMAAGLPVLASPSGAVNEAIQAGITGELLDTSKPEIWASAIYKIKASPAYADKLRRNARHWLAQNCDASQNAQALKELLIS